jgi:hypothetical protein
MTEAPTLIMNPNFTIHIYPEKLASLTNPPVRPERIRVICRNIRAMSPLITCVISNQLGFEVAPHKAPYLLTNGEITYKVRAITRYGVSLAPCHVSGSHRAQRSKAFAERLSALSGIIVYDLESIPDIPCWILPSETVIAWSEAEDLGRSWKLQRRAFLRLLDEYHPPNSDGRDLNVLHSAPCVGF